MGTTIGSYCQNAQDLTCINRLNIEGHFISNHSFNHKHLSSTNLKEFEDEIKDTEALLSVYDNFRKWFRFPYLDYGNRVDLGGSEDKFQAAMSILKKLGYQEGFVTINTFDWHIDSLFQQAVLDNKKIDFLQLRETYLSLLNDWCNFYINPTFRTPSANAG